MRLWQASAALAVAMTAVGVLAAAGGAGNGDRRVAIDVTPARIAVTIDGKLFTALHADKTARKLYLHPVMSASGKRVTRGFPMEPAPGESTDHEHQRGVWIGAEHVTGGDFWENEPSYHNPRAGTVTLTKVSDVRQGAGEGAFTIAADWIAPPPSKSDARPAATGDGDAVLVDPKADAAVAGKTVITETRTMTFRAPTPDTRAIDIDLRLRARTRVTFHDHHDALLGLRLATPFEIAKGGRLLNAEGLTEWEKLRGARSAWVDSLATLDGEEVGVAVMDAPTNFRFPTPWHVREYALVFASPFASRDYVKSAPDGSVTLQPGEELTLRYRILIHPPKTDVAAAFKEFAGK